jgi:hypothetical protein
MDQPPQPSRDRPHETLFKIAPDELKDKAPALHQIAQKERSRKARHHPNSSNAWVDTQLSGC